MALFDMFQPAPEDYPTPDGPWCVSCGYCSQSIGPWCTECADEIGIAELYEETS